MEGVQAAVTTGRWRNREEWNMKREDQKDATIRCLLLNFCLNMFRASLCPSSGEQRPYNMKREDQQDATIRCLLLNFCLNMFRASLYPSSGEQRPCYCIWCVVLVLLDVVGSGCGALSCRM